jgi:excisionase family DNA binding protein
MFSELFFVSVPAIAPRLLSTPDAAMYLGVEQSTVRRLVLSGEIPAITSLKHWRIDLRDLEAWIDRSKNIR